MYLISVRFTVSEMFEEVTKVFPDLISHLIKHDTYIAGGVFKSLVLDEVPNDWDFWFRSEEAKNKFVLALKDWQSTKACYLTNKDILKTSKISVLTDNAITLKLPKATIQFVLAQTGAPETVIGTFDFLHTKCYYDPVSGTMSCPTHDIINKKLKYTPSYHMPLNAMKRAIKFVKQGWDISDKEVDAIAKAIVGIDWKNPEVVKKQTKAYYNKPDDVAEPPPYIGSQDVPPQPTYWGAGLLQAPGPQPLTNFTVGQSWSFLRPESDRRETRTVTAIDSRTNEITITTGYEALSRPATNNDDLAF